MSKIKCNKCGADIKIKTLFLEKAGCENCGNSIDFTLMDSLNGLKQGLMLATAFVVTVLLWIFLAKNEIKLTELASVISSMSVQAAGIILIGACILVLIVGTLEKIIGCRIYEQCRKREEELERIAEQKRASDKTNSEI